MNKYILKLIKEQFNINDIDFSDTDSEQNANIFNKYITDPVDIYNKILYEKKVSVQDINNLNEMVAVVKPHNYEYLKKIVYYYSDMYPNASLNWLDISDVTDISHMF